MTRVRVVPPSEAVALTLLKALVIAWDADQDAEFTEALVAARAQLGFVLVGESDEEDAA